MGFWATNLHGSSIEGMVRVGMECLLESANRVSYYYVYLKLVLEMRFAVRGRFGFGQGVKVL